MMKRVSLLLLLIFAILLPVTASSSESASVLINANVKEGTGVGDEDGITVGGCDFSDRRIHWNDYDYNYWG